MTAFAEGGWRVACDPCGDIRGIFTSRKRADAAWRLHRDARRAMGRAARG